MGESLVYSSLQADSCRMAYELEATYYKCKWPEWTLTHGIAIDDSNINSVRLLLLLLSTDTGERGTVIEDFPSMPQNLKGK